MNLGDLGERITKDTIVPKIKGISKVRKLDLKGISGVPFDVIATYKEEIWLIETKTGKSSFEGIQAIQKKRMKKRLELLARNGINARPMLVQIKLETGEYIIKDFDITYTERGMAQTFERIVESIIDYRRTKS